MSDSGEQKENNGNIVEKKSKIANGQSVPKKKVLGVRNATPVQSKIPTLSKSGSHKKTRSRTSTSHTKQRSARKQAKGCPETDNFDSTQGQLTDLADGVELAVDEFRKQVNKFPNIPKGAKYDHKKRADAFKAAWMDLRKSAGGNCIQPVKKFIEQVKIVENQIDKQNYRLRAEQDMLSASCRSLEQEVNTLNMKVQMLSSESSNFATEKVEFKKAREQLDKKAQDLEKKIEEYAQKLATLTQEDAVTKEKLENVSKALAIKKEECLEQQAKFDQKASHDAEEAEKAKEAIRQTFEAEKASLHDKIASVQAELSGKIAELTSAGSNYVVLESKEFAAREEITSLQAQLAEQKETLHKQEIAAATHNSEIAHLKERLHDKDSQSAGMTEGLKQTLQMSEKRCEEFRLEKVQLAEKLGTVVAERRELEQTLTQTQAELTKLTRDFEEATNNIKKLEEERTGLQNSVTTLNVKNEALVEEKAKLGDELNAANSTVKTQKLQIENFEAELDGLRKEKVTLSVKLETTSKEMSKKIESTGEELRECKNNLRFVTDKKDSLETQIEAFTANQGASQHDQLQKICKLSVENETLKKRLGTASEHALHLQAAEEKIKELEEKIFAREAERRKLHNLVSELRGNVRVAVRVRPLLGKEPEEETNDHGIVMCDKKTQFVSLERNDPKKDDINYEFDKVFDNKTTQKDVFEDVSDLVQSALDGYQVCIFSYGQTGSGKTHTMQGGHGEMRGLIPRAVEKILATSEAMKEDGWEYTITTSFLEIYNETVNDLFKVKGKENVKYTIRQTKQGVEIDNLETEGLNDYSQLEGLLARAQRNKSVASTAMNQNSSRSHCCFILRIKGVNEKRKTVAHGMLNLVDLAGSERLDRSGVTGDRLKETLAINKSLSSLVDVFNALAKKSKHVPFRNSKLTFMLQGCLSGHGKTMMIVNVSPTTKSSNETLCSLRFAKSVNQTELGRAKKNVAASNTKRPSTAPGRSTGSSQGNSRPRPGMSGNTKRQRR
eukprot:g8090.t1